MKMTNETVDLVYKPVSTADTKDKTTYGDAAFSVAGPTKWNCLPGHIRLAPTIQCFKSKLKTYLFDIAFKLID